MSSTTFTDGLFLDVRAGASGGGASKMASGSSPDVAAVNTSDSDLRPSDSDLRSDARRIIFSSFAPMSCPGSVVAAAAARAGADASAAPAGSGAAAAGGNAGSGAAGSGVGAGSGAAAARSGAKSGAGADAADTGVLGAAEGGVGGGADG